MAIVLGVVGWLIAHISNGRHIDRDLRQKIVTTEYCRSVQVRIEDCIEAEIKLMNEKMDHLKEHMESMDNKIASILTLIQERH